MFGLAAALLYPLARPCTTTLRNLTFWIDTGLGITAMVCALYLVFTETGFYARGANFNGADWTVSALSILLVLEFTRRTTGWFIPVLIIIALSYVVLWGNWIGGVFHFPGLSWETLLRRSYYGEEGMFGPIARISWSFVFMFILFGAFLTQSGASEFIVRLAKAAARRLTGGPGLIAVLASGLMGSVTGSAVANTVATGSVTIPLMKRAGFPPRFAAGVEAAASTGGQLMPPVMGAGAFVMASFTQISYLHIVAVSVIPALLYFFTVGMFVRIEAQKAGLTPSAEAGETVVDVLRGGWTFLVPLLVLIGILVAGFTPTYAAGIATLSVIALSWLSGPRMGPSEILSATTMAVRSMTQTAILLVAVGLIINVIGMTGVGNTFSLMITSWAGDSLLLTIVLIALASLVLGMGLPVTAAYIVLATLAAPALTMLIQNAELVHYLMQGGVSTEAQSIFMLIDPNFMPGLPLSADAARSLLAQVPPEMMPLLTQSVLPEAVAISALLSAHLIVFWLSQDSNVTPPVALAAFAAATIAGTRPMRTGLTAWKLAKGLYLVPLLFAYTHLIGGTAAEIAWVTIMGTAAFLAFAGALEGWLEGPLSLPLRGLALVAGFAALPVWGFWPISLMGAAMALALLGRGTMVKFLPAAGS
jgi:TRAP transporter 4TM/12TM fusion protein